MRSNPAGRRRRGTCMSTCWAAIATWRGSWARWRHGLRILRGFDPCPDRWALGWYLRAMGELEAACEQNTLPYFRADVRLLQGRLPQVEAEGDLGRTEIAAFLMGRTTRLPADPLGCAIPRAQVLLYQGRAGRAWIAAEPEDIYELTGWEDDRARCRLYRAEAACRMDDRESMSQSLEAAARWVLHSGSMEHLCLYHLVLRGSRSGPAISTAAGLAADEGLHVARHCGFRLYQVELLCVQAELQLSGSCDTHAVRSAREAFELASSRDCLFLWGAAAAGHLLGQALSACGRVDEARAVLEATLSTRHRIGDSRAVLTEALLRSMRG